MSLKRTGAELRENEQHAVGLSKNTLIHLVKQMNVKEEYAGFFFFILDLVAKWAKMLKFVKHYKFEVFFFNESTFLFLLN